MAYWVRTVTGGGREEQMQVQDQVLFASAVIKGMKHPTAVARLRTEASSLTGIVYSNAVSIPCSGVLRRPCVMVRSEVERCS
jgi:hypothetical protein